MAALGIQNKNYLNVKNGSSPWLDAGGVNSTTDARGHAVFTDAAFGIRAGILQLRAYFFKHNRRTIAEILSRWAPATDTIGSLPGAPPNSPLEYSTFVAGRMGIGVNERLDIFKEDKTIGNIARLRDLFQAMAAFENGTDFVVPAEEFNAGLELVQAGILAAGTTPSPAPSVPAPASTNGAEWKITGSVGRWDKGAVNNKVDIETVQNMLRTAAMILHDSRVDPGGLDGKIAKNLTKSSTVQAIEAFQSRFLAVPDGLIDVGGRTWRELVEVLNGDEEVEETSLQPAQGSNFFFPFKQLPAKSWTTPPRSFASRRSHGKRAHAGCDLYAPKGTIIHAITDGTVIRGPYPFYAGTFALEIDHGTFIARYGEIQLTNFVREGDRVKAGQPIAKVGHLINIAVPSDMLHLELYDKSAHGPLSVKSGAGAKTSDGRLFYRRKDLIDPTPKLNEWKKNLPNP
ncbi:MAG TPA: peptidoglycan DD-metalloendopeptidase family protein [Blastocatellia bacterium]|nr:peptidoglycan DD-metalloendopeptidase family protein [Blastocatellia bacterium]